MDQYAYWMSRCAEHVQHNVEMEEIRRVSRPESLKMSPIFCFYESQFLIGPLGAGLVDRTRAVFESMMPEHDDPNPSFHKEAIHYGRTLRHVVIEESALAEKDVEDFMAYHEKRKGKGLFTPAAPALKAILERDAPALQAALEAHVKIYGRLGRHMQPGDQHLANLILGLMNYGRYLGLDVAVSHKRWVPERMIIRDPALFNRAV